MSPAEATGSAFCFHAEIEARLSYLNNDCDKLLDGSIHRGVNIARKGHWEEYAQKQAAMLKCLNIALR